MVSKVTSCFGGLRPAHIAGLLCLGALGLAGCGMHDATPSSSSSASGVSASVSAGPQLGLVWNSSDATLRPLSGVPGAASPGAPLFSPGAYVAAAWSPSSRLALLVDAKGNLQLLTPGSTQPATLTRGVPTGASIVFSPRGNSAVVFGSGAHSLLLLSGLAQQPAATTVQAAGAIQGAAVSDQGTIAIAAGVAGAVQVTTATAAGAAASVGSLGGFGGMAFLPGSDDLVVGDSVANTLSRFHSGGLVALAAQKDGLHQPFAVGVSTDAHWAVTANRADGTLVRVDLTSVMAPGRSSCACTPSQLTSLAGNAVFEVSAPGAGSGSAPGWMIEADDATPRVLFIPPASTKQQGGAQ